MPRPLRHCSAQYVAEIAGRTLFGLFRLAPKPLLMTEIIGIFGKAQERYPQVKLHVLVTMSNHYHALATCADANLLGRWLSWTKAAIARAAQFHHGFKGPVWGRRAATISVIDDVTLRDRVKYLMAQACAENLVLKPGDWPGVHCVDALCRGVAMRGSYVTADQRREAMRDGMLKLPMNQTLKLVPLPGLPENVHARQTWYRHIEKEIIAETRARMAADGAQPPSRRSLQDRSPDSRPKAFKPSPAPPCHGSCRRLIQAFLVARAAFTAQWREALDDMRRGVRICFPDGGWWPFGCREVEPRQQV